MHPTRDTLLLKFLLGAGGRVMPGVRCFPSSHTDYGMRPTRLSKS
jgi:hypothetical protein